VGVTIKRVAARAYSVRARDLFGTQSLNSRQRNGIAPILALQAADVPISMGVDGAASNEAADMISEVHAA
jgi:hypothetical protein